MVRGRHREEVGMPLDWWLAFLVFLVGAGVILLIALSRSRRKQRSSTEPELVLGPQPSTDRPLSTAAATHPATARPAPYLAYVPDAEPLTASKQPPDEDVGAETAPATEPSPSETAHSAVIEPEPPDSIEDDTPFSPANMDADTEDSIDDEAPAPTPPVKLRPAPPAPDNDVPWWERAFLDNPPPEQEIVPSARPWHGDEPLPAPPPQDRRSQIHALLTMGARSSTTVTSGAVKGNRSSGLYHTVESPWYGRTKADEWFDTPGKAEAAGYIRWDDKTNRRTG